MDEDNKEILDPSNSEGNGAADVPTADELAKAKELANNYKIRAEKAEALNKKPVDSSSKGERLADDDIIFLAQSQLHGEDRAEVLKVAKAMNMTAEQAHTYLKPVIEVRVEERRSAVAAQGPKSAGGAPQASIDALQQKAREGKLSESEIVKLVDAEFAAKKAVK